MCHHSECAQRLAHLGTHEMPVILTTVTSWPQRRAGSSRAPLSTVLGERMSLGPMRHGVGDPSPWLVFQNPEMPPLLGGYGCEVRGQEEKGWLGSLRLGFHSPKAPGKQN